MNVSHEVILDLLPLYLEGEASPATRALVESYLAEHAAFAEQVRLQRSDDFGALGAATPGMLTQDLELRTLSRTRALLRWQRWLFGLGLGLTMSAFSTVISFTSRGVSTAHLLLRDYPQILVPIATAGVGCLVAYVVISRRLRTRHSRQHDGW